MTVIKRPPLDAAVRMPLGPRTSQKPRSCSELEENRLSLMNPPRDIHARGFLPFLFPHNFVQLVRHGSDVVLLLKEKTLQVA